MDELSLRMNVEDLSEVVRLATLAFDDFFQGTGTDYETRMRAILDDLRDQADRLLLERPS
ncbi:hypothetical protein RWH43_17390 [Microbacterium sp. KSW2-21]|uniref:Uncharacterized protein n=1 Tax=Microbacterium algihabitans TaxID=3075992 RepID=A0ABU3S083_9MICO|nr:hypothetical protein [Microbacterium sp. KSW2-21]MDU0328537.1 hypothetical protein [Microbacterium sp. KSW2-21]